MNSQELIEKYNLDKRLESEERDAEIKRTCAKAEEIFKANIAVWLGDILSEFELGKIHMKGTFGKDLQISMEIKWQDVPGIISMQVLNRKTPGYSRTTDAPKLRFNFYRVDRAIESNSREDYFDVRLPLDTFTEVFEQYELFKASSMIESVELAKLLSDVLEEKSERQKLDQSDIERKRFRDIGRLADKFNFQRWDKLDVQEHYEECIKKFPELEDQWNDLRAKYIADENSHKAVIAEKERQELEERAQYESEEAHLENEAASRFEPIILYRVFHGAKAVTEDNEPDFYTDSILVLGDEPDKDGYFYRIDRGQINRVKCPHIIRIEELIFNSEHEVPDSYPDYPFTKSFIKSEIFDDLKRWYFVIPPEVTRLAEVE